jgi:hypothetical protein
MRAACIGDKRIQMCQSRACISRKELSCLGCLVDHIHAACHVVRAKGSRAVLVLSVVVHLLGLRYAANQG